jgi:hypothetical protein
MTLSGSLRFKDPVPVVSPIQQKHIRKAIGLNKTSARYSQVVYDINDSPKFLLTNEMADIISCDEHIRKLQTINANT